jgi:hypothetical protein
MLTKERPEICHTKGRRYKLYECVKRQYFTINCYRILDGANSWRLFFGPFVGSGQVLSFNCEILTFYTHI